MRWIPCPRSVSLGRLAGDLFHEIVKAPRINTPPVQFATHAKLKCDDYYHNGARRRLRLHEKDGKEHERPVHHLLEQILDRKRA
jgi:hypothetical protein